MTSENTVPNLNKAYLQSRNDLVGLPNTTETKVERGKLPNIFRINPRAVPNIWIQKPELVKRFVKLTKGDIGGIGGHVEASALVEATVLDYVLRHNRFNKGPIFESVIATHIGDDIAITGVFNEKVIKKSGLVDGILWDAFNKGTDLATELGLYGPGQDLKVDSFTGNLHGSGLALIVLPLPYREDPSKASQTVVLGTADKTDPGTMNYITSGAYLNEEFNTGLLIANSAMRNGYLFEIVDVDTKEQAMEAGVPVNDKEGLDKKMSELGKTERTVVLDGVKDCRELRTLLMSGSRYVIRRVFLKGKDDQIGETGVVVTAERLHNIRTKDGFVYGGKDDPGLLALAQGDWPAPGEITSPIARTPVVAGDCRGSHWLPIYPVPICEQTSYWSGPILSVITMSINLHTGRIGAISDQFARGTPWDTYRQNAAGYMLWFRYAHGSKEPGTLPASDQEYHTGYERTIKDLAERFQRKAPETI